MDALLTIAAVAAVLGMLGLLGVRLRDAWREDHALTRHQAEARRRAGLAPPSRRDRQLQNSGAVLAALGLLAALALLQVPPVSGLLMALAFAGAWQSWQPAPTRDPHAPATHVACGASDPNAQAETKIRDARASLNPPPGFDGCRTLLRLDTAFRCTECGRFFHRACAEHHFRSHGAVRRTA